MEKDGEFVNFDKSCMCVGQVESWLNDLPDTMTSTIHHEFMEAVVTYEEKAREQWIFDPPTQVGGGVFGVARTILFEGASQLALA